MICDVHNRHAAQWSEGYGLCLFRAEDIFDCHYTDARLRSSIIDHNATVVMADGKMDLGKFGRIHFIDWDQTRARSRTVQVMIIGE